MPEDKGKEPQSYGSEKDWLTGKTGQTVDGSAEKTSRRDEAFYESRHDAHEAPTDPSDDVAPKPPQR